MDEYNRNGNGDEFKELREVSEVIGTPDPTPPQVNIKKEIFEWAEAIIFAVVIAFIIKTFFFTLVLVDGPSMENTLHSGDRLFVNRFMYEPKDGDIIVFTPENFPDKPFIKRVIATEGETVDINYDTGEVYVNGNLLQEDYIKVPTTRAGDVQFPVTVPEGYFFAMGDNRGNSHDCRDTNVGDEDNQMGMVSNKRVMGKAMFRLWPFSQFGSLY